MGQRTKGNMWCKRDGPVLGVKNTHRVRNTGALVGSLAIPGAFLFGKVEGYYCPKCGAKVTSLRFVSEVDRIDMQNALRRAALPPPAPPTA